MRESIRYDTPRHLPLERVVPDAACCVEPFLDIPRLEPIVRLVGQLCPNTSQAVRLKLHAYLDLIGFALWQASLKLLNLL